MPDDNQSTANPSTTDSTSPVTDAAADVDVSEIKIPSLDDLEYATPSAYIDPDLQADPEPVEEPTEEPKEEEPAPEEPKAEPETTEDQVAEAIKASNETMAAVAEKIANARNILVALSSNPSVDELASAIALSLFLDRNSKHAIAIYSGEIPNALEFLSPEDTFEKNTDVLQDFVIALSKEKADHLRYKLDGDFVKIFITPYKDRIVSEDLEFSYGDYNVDLVLALNVTSGENLDEALSEYNRIMDDAAVVNITTDAPGKLGEIEWVNKYASSVSEIISGLLLSVEGDTKLNAEEATALLTGIVAATDRFASANTYPGTMQIASRLLDAGADQQLVAANTSDDVDGQLFTFADSEKPQKSSQEDSDNIKFSFEPTKDSSEDEKSEEEDDATSLKISHGEEDETPEDETPEDKEEKPTEEPAEEPKEELKIEAPEEKPSKPEPKPIIPEIPKPEIPKPELPEAESAPTEKTPAEAPIENSALLDELKATEASLSNVDTTTEAATAATTPAAPTTEAVVTPPATSVPAENPTNKYGQMLENAIAEPTTPNETPMASALPPAPNPAATSAPDVTNAPEATNLPEINYGQNPSDQLLPPPPVPPVDMNAPIPMPIPTDLPPATGAPATPSTPATPPAPTPGFNPAVSAAPDASAFTIPGV